MHIVVKPPISGRLLAFVIRWPGGKNEENHESLLHMEISMGKYIQSLQSFNIYSTHNYSCLLATLNDDNHRSLINIIVYIYYISLEPIVTNAVVDGRKAFSPRCPHLLHEILMGKKIVRTHRGADTSQSDFF